MSSWIERSKDIHARLGMDLCYAIKQGNNGKVITLLDAGAPINYQDASGWTPLTYAAAYKDNAIAITLLERGADVNLCNINGDSAAMCAVIDNSLHVLFSLLKHGADMTFTNRSGRTAAEWAKKYNKHEALVLLNHFTTEAFLMKYINTAIPAILRLLCWLTLFV